MSVLAWSLEAARSGLPSPLKSPAATPLAPGAGSGAPSAAKPPPAWRRSAVTGAGGVAGHREVGSPVGVEVGGGQAERAGADRDRRLGREAAARIAQQHVDRVRPEHGHGDVGQTVAVEVGRLDALGRGADRDRRGLRGEAVVARVAQEHGHRAGAEVGDGQVRAPVAVEVGGHDVARAWRRWGWVPSCVKPVPVLHVGEDGGAV